MDKKRSIGISVASLVLIIFFGYSFLFFIFLFPAGNRPWFIVLRYTLCIIVSLLGLIASIFILDIKRWARKLILYTCSFFLGLGIVTDGTQLIISKWIGVQSLLTRVYVVFSIKKFGLYIFWLILIVFLTRPKVKNQFK